MDQAGFAEDLEVVGDGRLGFAQGPYEVADAHLAFGGGGEHGEDPEPDRVCKGREPYGEGGGIVSIKRRAEH